MNTCGDDDCTDPDCPGTGRHPLITRPTPKQRAEMAAYIEEKQPGLLVDLGMASPPITLDHETLMAIAEEWIKDYDIYPVDHTRPQVIGAEDFGAFVIGNWKLVPKARVFESGQYRFSTDATRWPIDSDSQSSANDL